MCHSAAAAGMDSRCGFSCSTLVVLLLQIHMSRWTCIMERNACARRKPMWRKARLTRCLMSSLSSIYPPKRAWGTPAWSYCWWTQTWATHAAPTPSLGALCWAHRQQVLPGSTGGRSATTRVARSPSGMSCQRIRKLGCWWLLSSISDLVQPREGRKEDGWDPTSCLPVTNGLKMRAGWIRGEWTLMCVGGVHFKWCHHSIVHSFNHLSLKYLGFSGRAGAWQKEPQSFKRFQRLSLKITWKHAASSTCKQPIVTVAVCSAECL